MKRLLVKKPLEKIFVTDICKEAEIERLTFYYPFRGKYDLMSRIFCQQTMKTDALSIDSAAKAMNGMRQGYIFFRRAFEDNSQSPMWAYMHACFVKRDIWEDKNMVRQRRHTQNKNIDVTAMTTKLVGA